MCLTPLPGPAKSCPLPPAIMGDSQPPPPPATTQPPPPEAGAEAYSAWVFEQLQHHDGVIFDCDGTLVDSYVVSHSPRFAMSPLTTWLCPRIVV